MEGAMMIQQKKSIPHCIAQERERNGTSKSRHINTIYRFFMCTNFYYNSNAFVPRKWNIERI